MELGLAHWQAPTLDLSLVLDLVGYNFIKIIDMTGKQTTP